MDMQANMITYWGFFLVIFIIWTAYRTWRMAEDRRQHREIMDALICLINMHRGDNMPKLKPQQPLPNKE